MNELSAGFNSVVLKVSKITLSRLRSLVLRMILVWFHITPEYSTASSRSAWIQFEGFSQDGSQDIPVYVLARSIRPFH